MPSVGATTWVKLEVEPGLVDGRLGRGDLGLRRPGLPWTASSSSSWLIALSLARGVSRFTSRSALPSWALAWASMAWACASGRRERPRVDLKEDVAPLHEGALLVVLLHQVPGHLRADLARSRSRPGYPTQSRTTGTSSCSTWTTWTSAGGALAAGFFKQPPATTPASATETTESLPTRLSGSIGHELGQPGGSFKPEGPKFRRLDGSRSPATRRPSSLHPGENAAASRCDALSRPRARGHLRLPPGDIPGTLALLRARRIRKKPRRVRADPRHPQRPLLPLLRLCRRGQPAGCRWALGPVGGVPARARTHPGRGCAKVSSSHPATASPWRAIGQDHLNKNSK